MRQRESRRSVWLPSTRPEDKGRSFHNRTLPKFRRELQFWTYKRAPCCDKEQGGLRGQNHPCCDNFTFATAKTGGGFARTKSTLLLQHFYFDRCPIPHQPPHPKKNRDFVVVVVLCRHLQLHTNCQLPKQKRVLRGQNQHCCYKNFILTAAENGIFFQATKLYTDWQLPKQEGVCGDKINFAAITTLL